MGGGPGGVAGPPERGGRGVAPRHVPHHVRALHVLLTTAQFLDQFAPFSSETILLSISVLKHPILEEGKPCYC